MATATTPGAGVPGGEALRIGLSGCGTIGALHARNLAAAGAALVFHNRTPATAEAFAHRFGGEACADFGDLLRRCDAVVVATPPGQHTETVLAALAAARPVLVEKPLCGTPDELARIEAAAAAAPLGAFVMVAENYYYKPSLEWLREVIAWRGIGAVQSMALQKLTRQAAAGWKADWGALLEGGIHFVALAADLADAAGIVVATEAALSGAIPVDAAAAGAEPVAANAAEVPESVTAPLRTPVEVHAVFPTLSASRGAERQVRIECVYDDGLRVRLHYAWDVPSLTKGIFQHSRVDGEDGRIWFESNGLYAHLRGPGRKGWTFPGLGDLMGYGAMTADFLRCVAATRAAAGATLPYSGLARARRDLGIVFRAYQQLP